jgi:hypothetical protein
VFQQLGTYVLSYLGQIISYVYALILMEINNLSMLEWLWSTYLSIMKSKLIVIKYLVLYD